MKYGRRYIMLDRPARFIDGRLRVAEQVVLNQLADQLPYNIYYRNLAGNSADDRHPPEEQDQFFSFLLHKQFSHNRTNLGGIALDPAHGGDDVGVIGLDGIKEKDVALALALDLQRHIKMQSGTPVYLSRDEDYTLKRSERLGMARENPVDLLLLMHAQAALDPDQSGIHVYVRTRSGGDSPTTFTPGGSMSLALRLSSALRDAGFLVHEVENSALLPIPRGDLPAVLIEFGYLSNASDVQMLTREAERKRLVTALLKGIQAFHNNLESI
jgi:N-acetylmuramoyl-L-alanine amidase